MLVAKDGLAGRFALDGEIEVAGDGAALRSLAERLLVSSGVTVSLDPLAADAMRPYDGALTTVTVRPEGREAVSVRRRGHRLVIRGGRENLAILAANVRFLADCAATSGGHLHLDYHPGHAYLAKGTQPVVIIAVPR